MQDLNILEVNDNNIKEIEKYKLKIEMKIKQYYDDKLKDETQNNLKYVNKMYKRTLSNGNVQYCKIMSINPTNKYRLNVLQFILPETIDFIDTYLFNNDRLKLIGELLSIEDAGLLCNDIESIQYINIATVDLNFKFPKVIDTYTEITKDEFNEAFTQWFTYIKYILNEDKEYTDEQMV